MMTSISFLLLLCLFTFSYSFVVTNKQNAFSTKQNTHQNTVEGLDCANFNPSKIKLVTFDVFAALMDTETSLNKNIATILPKLSSSEIASLVDQWLNWYGSYAGVIFQESSTGSSPFQWVIRQGLDSILKSMNISVTSSEYEALIAAWGILIPWPNTKDVMIQLFQANLTLATLSNGDKGTLKSAASVFFPEAPFTTYFSSDFPVGSFKPDVRMYNQVIENTFGFNEEEILHVAGSPIDGGGARSAGMFSALLSLYPDPTQPTPCFLLKDITELPAVLGL